MFQKRSSNERTAQEKKGTCSQRLLPDGIRARMTSTLPMRASFLLLPVPAFRSRPPLLSSLIGRIPFRRRQWRRPKRHACYSKRVVVRNDALPNDDDDDEKEDKSRGDEEEKEENVQQIDVRDELLSKNLIKERRLHELLDVKTGKPR